MIVISSLWGLYPHILNTFTSFKSELSTRRPGVVKQVIQMGLNAWSFFALSLAYSIWGAHQMYFLLNSKYKKITKIWQPRISEVADLLMRWNQSPFLKGHLIQHTILLCSEVPHYTRNNTIPAIFLKINFRMAFDLLQWDFIYTLFCTMGFGPVVANIFHAISKGSSSQVLVNGLRERTFAFTKVVRQGCPLSLLIFIFAMHALSNCITQEQWAGRLRGICPPHFHLDYVQT